MEKTIVFGNTRFPAPANVTTLEQARMFAQMIIPDLGDAEGRIEDNNFVFVRRSGTKGL